jgi:aminoglycoside phosphotransferase (APT) family kinase protein
MDAELGVVPVREAHRFDEAALAGWCERHLEGFRRPLAVAQFEGGQSNPSFLLESGGGRYVLRKQPPGRLLPSAHRVDREHRVLSALRGTGVPVPRSFALCEDPALIGTSFFVMEFVPGRVVRDPRGPGLRAEERAAAFADMVEVLARLHALDPAALGLGDFGPPGSYYARQLRRWSRQYELSRTDAIPAMEALLGWLPAHLPEQDETTLVHGDYRLGNLILHPSEPRVVAVLDWELSTLGHPLADLAYHCVFDVLGTGLEEDAAAGAGIPSESEYLAAYRRWSGRDPGRQWSFALAFSLFRLAAITQGVYARALQGNAASATALEAGRRVAGLAERALAIASR